MIPISSIIASGNISPIWAPILIPTSAFIFVLGILLIGSLAKVQSEKERQNTIRLALEKGQPLTPELFKEPGFSGQKDDRRGGLILIAVGVGLFIALSFFTPCQSKGIEWFAAIPFFVGIAKLFNWFLQRKGGGNDPKS